MAKLRFLFSVLFDVITGVRARENREQDRLERLLERRHQIQLVETFMTKLVDVVATQNTAIVELAKAQSAHADAFAQWIKGFQMPVGDAVPSSVVREEDEFHAEQERLKASGFPAGMPPEFQLAAALERLNNDTLGDFDREGSDF